MMKILVTGFQPFGTEPTNPSLDAVALMPAQIGEAQIVCRALPVEFMRAPELMKRYIDEQRPDAVVAVGQAGGRAEVCIERVALNLATAKNPDMAGYAPQQEEIIKGGPAACFSTLPVDRLAEKVKRAGVPCRVSNTAGLYVCNTLLYHLLHTFPHIPACFVHMPYSTAQAVGKPAGTPSMAISTMAQALQALLAAIQV